MSTSLTVTQLQLKTFISKQLQETPCFKSIHSGNDFTAPIATKSPQSKKNKQLAHIRTVTSAIRIDEFTTLRFAYPPEATYSRCLSLSCRFNR